MSMKNIWRLVLGGCAFFWLLTMYFAVKAML